MSKFFKQSTDKHFSEHHKYPDGEDISMLEIDLLPFKLFLNKTNCKCFEIKNKSLHTSYYIGVDWLDEKNQLAIYVEPKLNKNSIVQTNYLKILFSALKHPDVAQHADELFEIKFDAPYIKIKQKEDLLTPLLVVQFLKVVQEIVRKGLKKSYYKVEQNLYGKVKGKILVGQTVKQNLLKNKPLNTICSYEEFGLNSLENRLLKKALGFIQRYLPTIKHLKAEAYTANIFNYILPAFQGISEEIELNDIKNTQTNAFYKEYKEAIRLAKLILKRFGYNIINTEQQDEILIPPFWIDMSKLFELYVLGLLKDKFGYGVKYHFTKNGNELDYLLDVKGYQMIVDAKYKEIYQTDNDINDIRQLSGYSRLKGVYDELKKNDNEVIDCLIIYPDQNQGNEDFKTVDLTTNSIKGFVHFYKVPIKIPIIG